MAYIFTRKDFPDTIGKFVSISDTAEEMKKYLKEEFFLDISVEELKKEKYLYIDDEEWEGTTYEIEEVEKVSEINKRKSTGEKISEFCGFENFLSKISQGYHEKEWGINKKKYMKHAKKQFCREMEEWEEDAKRFDDEN